ncbi:MAG: hypothetical protein PHY05_11015 [Methanothrix sp.]|nr:hypothetical protein [Methanothrix sp.]
MTGFKLSSHATRRFHAPVCPGPDWNLARVNPVPTDCLPPTTNPFTNEYALLPMHDHTMHDHKKTDLSKDDAKKLLIHWIEHNESHSASFRDRAVQVAKVSEKAAKDIEQAAAIMDQCTEMLRKAMKDL